MNWLRRLVLWIAWYVPLGKLAPHLMAFGLGTRQYRKVNVVGTRR